MQKKIVLLILIDQITKLIFSHRDFFVGPLHIHAVRNSGLAFGLDLGGVINIILIAIGLSLFFYYYQKKDLAFALIFAGAISNIMDRLYFGYVRDFLDIGLGFTFNAADAFVVAGLIIILISQSKSKSADNF